MILAVHVVDQWNCEVKLNEAEAMAHCQAPTILNFHDIHEEHLHYFACLQQIHDDAVGREQKLALGRRQTLMVVVLVSLLPELIW